MCGKAHYIALRGQGALGPLWGLGQSPKVLCARRPLITSKKLPCKYSTLTSANFLCYNYIVYLNYIIIVKLEAGESVKALKKFLPILFMAAVLAALVAYGSEGRDTPGQEKAPAGVSQQALS